VDDLVNEVFLVAWRRFDQIPQDPRPWLLGARVRDDRRPGRQPSEPRQDHDAVRRLRDAVRCHHRTSRSCTLAPGSPP